MMGNSKDLKYVSARLSQIKQKLEKRLKKTEESMIEVRKISRELEYLQNQ